MVSQICDQIRHPPPLLHILIGARQVGKTTLALQIVKKLGLPHRFASADAPLPPGPEWIESHWAQTRSMFSKERKPVILVLDEIQKVRGWSETVKRLWDEDRRHQAPIHVLLLGSSVLLLQKGMSESLAGRFFLHRFPHWSWTECHKAFGWNLERWLYFGGYPGAALLISKLSEWKRYIADSLIETVLSRDVLQLQTVAKPSLLRHLFALSATFPARIFSYNKMLGQLQDAGNTTTLAHYIKLLETAFLVSGLELFSAGHQRKRGSSPKLILWNNALIHALSSRTFKETRADDAGWGYVVENAVGAHFLNHLPATDWTITYWRDGPAEVDFVLTHGSKIWALEVKSGRAGRISGMHAFRKKYPRARTLLIGAEGIPLEDFFSTDPESFLS